MTKETELVTLKNIQSAKQVIRYKLHRTPLVSSRTIGELCKVELYLKLELFQKTGSFKPRGVLNKLSHLSQAEKQKGVISISAGNHAQALAWGATLEGIESTIVMPSEALKNKVEATKYYGGNVILTSENLLETCLTIQKERDLTLVHPFDDLHVIAGQGTTGLEIMEELKEPDMVIVAVGGGGLISGIAVAVKSIYPNTRVVGVEPAGSSVMTQSLEKGEPVQLESMDTIADGLSAPFAGKHTLHHVQAFVDEMVLLSDDEIVENMVLLMERAKILPEPSGAASLAALRSGKLNISNNMKVVCVICGGNIGSKSLKELL